MTMALKLVDDLALTKNMPISLTNVALDLGEVVDKQRPLHAR